MHALDVPRSGSRTDQRRPSTVETPTDNDGGDVAGADGRALATTLSSAAGAAPADVPSYLDGGGHGNFNAAETQVTTATASQLTLQWTATSHSGGYIATQPVVADGVVYWGDSDGYEHANNATTGAALWGAGVYVGTTGALDTPDLGACGPNVLGANAAATVVALPNPNNGGTRQVVLVPGGGNLGPPNTQNTLYYFALDPATGHVLWQTLVGNAPTPAAHGDASPGYDTLWAAPQVFNGNVYLAVGGHGDCPHHTISRVVELAGGLGATINTLQFNTAFGASSTCVGGDIWGTPTIDASAGMMYIATGDATGSTCSEPWASALLKVNLANLTVVDFTNLMLNPNNDYDFGSTPVLFTGQVGGWPRRWSGWSTRTARTTPGSGRA